MTDSSSGKTTATATATDSTSKSTTSTASASRTTITSTSSYTRPEILGPLTTTFTPPSHCTEVYTYGCEGCDFFGTIGQTCTSELGNLLFTQDPSCLPPVTKTDSYDITFTSGSVETIITPDSSGFYSPGIACPVGYATACAVQVGTNGLSSSLSHFNSFAFQYPPLVNETAVGCCPTGYQCESLDYGQDCSLITAQTTLAMVTCVNLTSTFSPSTTQLILPTEVVETDGVVYGSGTSSGTTSIQTTTLSFIYLYASMIQVNYQSTDVPSSSSISSSLSPTATSNDTSFYSTSAKSSDNGSNHETTTIAVAVVIPCVAVLVAAAVGWFWYRRKARKDGAAAAAASYHETQPPEMDGQNKSYVPAEVSGEQARFEIPGSTPQYEMAGTNPNEVVHEMDGGDVIPYHDEDD